MCKENVTDKMNNSPGNKNTAANNDAKNCNDKMSASNNTERQGLKNIENWENSKADFLKKKQSNCQEKHPPV